MKLKNMNRVAALEKTKPSSQMVSFIIRHIIGTNKEPEGYHIKRPGFEKSFDLLLGEYEKYKHDLSALDW